MLGSLDLGFDQPSARVVGELEAELAEDLGLVVGVKTNDGETATVSCPPNPSMTVGTKFTCIATAADGSTIPVDVTVTDNTGDITWQVGDTS